MEITDDELIRQYLAGDSSGFELLYERYKKRLYGYLSSLLPGARSDVDDIFQKTWIKAAQQMDRYRDKGCFTAWLFRIGRNQLIDEQRRKKSRITAVSINDEENPLTPGAPNGYEPWRELDETELHKVLEQAVSTLPTEQQEVFRFRQEGMAFKEIAARQNCPLNTALARMQYALKGLRDFLSSIDKGGLIK